MIGGILCVIGQILMDLTNLSPARILVIYVVAGAVLTAVGVYQYLVDFSGAGASVPLTGFGYSLAKGAMTAARADGLMGALTGGLKATSAGIAAAVFFGLLNTLIFNPRGKK